MIGFFPVCADFTQGRTSAQSLPRRHRRERGSIFRLPELVVILPSVSPITQAAVGSARRSISGTLQKCFFRIVTQIRGFCGFRITFRGASGIQKNRGGTETAQVPCAPTLASPSPPLPVLPTLLVSHQHTHTHTHLTLLPRMLRPRCAPQFILGVIPSRGSGKFITTIHR